MRSSVGETVVLFNRQTQSCLRSTRTIARTVGSGQASTIYICNETQEFCRNFGMFRNAIAMIVERLDCSQNKI